jgi:hypothetical protein
MKAIVLIGAIWLGAWLGLTVAERYGLAPETRIVCGFAGCWIAGVLEVACVAYGRAWARRGKG